MSRDAIASSRDASAPLYAMLTNASLGGSASFRDASSPITESDPPASDRFGRAQHCSALLCPT